MLGVLKVSNPLMKSTIPLFRFRWSLMTITIILECLPSSDLSESVSIFISFLSILDNVCIGVHELTNDTTGLVGETLTIDTCEGK